MWQLGACRIWDSIAEEDTGGCTAGYEVPKGSTGLVVLSTLSGYLVHTLEEEFGSQR